MFIPLLVVHGSLIDSIVSVCTYTRTHTYIEYYMIYTVYIDHACILDQRDLSLPLVALVQDT